MVVVTTPPTFVSAAIDAALEAGKLLQQMLPESWASKEVATKRTPSDFVTREDRVAEALIARLLRERFPDHGILARVCPMRVRSTAGSSIPLTGFL